MPSSSEFPLAFSQRQLWFLEQLASGRSGYNLLDAYRLQGKLEMEFVEKSFASLVQRHTALRTFIKDSDGEPVQVIKEALDVSIAKFDLRHLPYSDREAEARQIAENEAQRVFDLTQLPLWRIALIQLGEQEHWLIFPIHHIIFDGWSSDLFWREFITIYEALENQRPYPFPEPALQMEDFWLWQQQRVQEQAAGQLLPYWKQKLGGSLPVLDFPTDFPRPALPTHQGGTMALPLAKALSDKLYSFTQQNHTTLFTVLLTAYKVLLFRWTGQTDLVVGTPFACRSQPGHEGIIGFLVNTLALRSELNGDQSFLDLLPQVAATALEAYDHGDLPFSLLVETIRPERDLRINPVFQTMFQMSHQSDPLPAPSTLAFTPLLLEDHTATFDLTLEVAETPDGLVAWLEYSSDLFRPSSMERLLQNFTVLLESIVHQPRQPIAQLPLLLPKECHQILNVWNNASFADHRKLAPDALRDGVALTLSIQSGPDGLIGQLNQQGDLRHAAAISSALENFLPHLRRAAEDPGYTPPDQIDLSGAPLSQLRFVWGHRLDSASDDAPVQCLHRYFEDRVRQSPNHIALCHDARRLTYAELNAAANQIAHALLERGVKPDQPVGLCLERSIDMVIALLAILKSGGAYLPLDPDYPAERISYMIEDADLRIVLTHDHLKARLPGSVTHIVCLDKDRARLAAFPQVDPNVAVETQDLAYIIYTSGSTGRPKGVMIEHAAVAHFINAAIRHYELTATDCMLQFGSISFDLAVEEIFGCLCAGARLHLRNDDMLSSPARFLQTCLEWGVSVLDLPTAYWHQLMGEITHQGLHFPPDLRLVIIGGERALPSVIRAWQESIGAYPRLFNSYGPTEATVVATGFWITPDAIIQNEVPIGRPLTNSEIYVLDPQGQPTPIGVPGELHIGGLSLARGYLNRSDLTELKFIRHPILPALRNRLYKTGDRARFLPDGNLEFLGRIDNQVKIRGFRIELGEIESAILQYPGIREALVVAQAPPSGEQRLTAYIVLNAGEEIADQDLRVHLQQYLPAYMIPASMLPLEAIPLTPNGKVDIPALPQPTQIHESSSASGRRPLAPRTPLETTLAKIWSEVLQVPSVGIRDGLFSLGGHSLQALQIIARIKKELGIDVTLSSLFATPTVEEMADSLSQSGARGCWTPLAPLQPSGTKRPFFAIHGGHGEILFYKALADSLGKDQPFYGFRSKGNDYPDMPHRRVEEMAACYLEALQEMQPEGPYRIGGASFGGIVAYEMAQQLYLKGEKVDLLVLFDTGGFDDFIRRLPLGMRLRNILRYLPQYGLAETWKRIHLKILKLFTTESVIEYYRATGELPDPASPAMAVWQAVWEANLTASENYTPRPYPGTITLLRAIDDGDLLWNTHSDDYGWAAYAQGGVETYDLPGTHIGIFQEPHVRTLAKTLAELLNRA